MNDDDQPYNAINIYRQLQWGKRCWKNKVDRWEYAFNWESNVVGEHEKYIRAIAVHSDDSRANREQVSLHSGSREKEDKMYKKERKRMWDGYNSRNDHYVYDGSEAVYCTWGSFEWCPSQNWNGCDDKKKMDIQHDIILLLDNVTNKLKIWLSLSHDWFFF